MRKYLVCLGLAASYLLPASSSLAQCVVPKPNISANSKRFSGEKSSDSEAMRRGFDVLYGDKHILHTVCKLESPDPYLYPPGYEQAQWKPLKLKDKTINLSETISIYIASDGAGRLDIFDSSNYFKHPHNLDSNGFSVFADSLRFTEVGHETKSLSIFDAARFWGEGVKHESREGSYFTFDAVNEQRGESNVYHLDFKPAQEGSIVAYRLRGIGITNPKWIVE